MKEKTLKVEKKNEGELQAEWGKREEEVCFVLLYHLHFHLEHFHHPLILPPHSSRAKQTTPYNQGMLVRTAVGAKRAELKDKSTIN